MFTGGSKFVDIVREAEKKRLDREPRVTFLGKPGTSLSAHVELWLGSLAGLDSKLLSDWSDRILESFDCNDGFLRPSEDIDHCQEIFSCLFSILEVAISKRVSKETVEQDLSSLLGSSEKAKIIANKLHIFHKKQIQPRILSAAPQLEQLRWRLDMNLAENGELDPLITFQMQLDDGNTRQFETSQKSLQRLRYEVAKALSQMAEVDRHPMMKIVSALEDDKRKKL